MFFLFFFDGKRSKKLGSVRMAIWKKWVHILMRAGLWDKPFGLSTISTWICTKKLFKLLILIFFNAGISVQANFWKSYNGIGILVGRAVLKFLIKTNKILFLYITQEPFSLLKFYCHSWVSQTNFFWTHLLFFNMVLIIFR